MRSYPLLELAYIHGHDCTPFNTADKIALLLSRGADVNQRGYSGDNCLHYLMTYNWCPFHSKHVLCRSLEPRGELCRSLKRRDELRDILTLMITAGADVYAVNDYEMSVSDTANRYGHSQVWAEVLETCGYDVHKVYEGDDGGCGWSSAIDDPCQKHVAEQTFKLSFAEYLVRREEKRKVSCPVTEISDYENDEEEYIRERRLRDFALNEEEQSYTSTRNAGSDSDSDMYGEKSNEEEDDAETMRNWNVGGDPDSDEESSEDIYNCKTKRD